MSFSELLRVPPGGVDLDGIDTRSTPGSEGDKAAGKEYVADLADELADLQEKLFAEGYAGGTRSLLLVIQGMDTSGKGGALKHCVGVFDPGGVDITSFKKPTEEERGHDFLWRIEQHAPRP